MTVTTDKTKDKVSGTGGAGPYSFSGIKLINPDVDLQVAIEDANGDLGNTLIPGVNYTIDYNDATISFDINFLGGLTVPLTEKVFVNRVTPLLQPIKISESGEINTKTYEAMNDRVTIQNQDQKTQIDSSFRLKPNVTDPVSLELGKPIPGRAVIGNSTGDGLIYSDSDLTELDQAIEEAIQAKDDAIIARDESQGFATDSQNSATASQNSANTSSNEADRSESEADRAKAFAEAANGVRLGSIDWLDSPDEPIPAGWVRMDGQTVSASTYPDYVALKTGDSSPTATYTIPNLNLVGVAEATQGGAFLRGNNGTTTVGTYQEDTTQRLESRVMGIEVDLDSTGAFYTVSSSGRDGADHLTNLNFAMMFDNDRVVRTSDEDRPKSFTAIAITKVFGTVVNPGGIDIGGLAQDVLDNEANIATNTAAIANCVKFVDWTSPVSYSTGSTHTAPSDGYVRGTWAVSGAQSGQRWLSIDGQFTFALNKSYQNATTTDSNIAPVKAGQTFNMQSGNTGLAFYPALT